MKTYRIESTKSTNIYIKEFETNEDCRHWIINNLNLSLDWNYQVVGSWKSKVMDTKNIHLAVAYLAIALLILLSHHNSTESHLEALECTEKVSEYEKMLKELIPLRVEYEGFKQIRQ